MYRIKLLFLFVGALGLLSACELDNYERPNAELSGTFIDIDTKEPVQQDIIRGTTIEIKEHGFATMASQFLIVKNNGSYANSMLFANTYTIQPVRGNFIPVEPQDVNISGQTKLDFEVKPYIRIKEVNIAKNGTKVVATFKLQQNVINKVKKIGLYAHAEPNVGEPMRQAAREQTINAVTDPNQVYALEIDLAANSATLKAGTEYFFRVGALIDVGEAKLNYAPAVRIKL